MSRRSALAGGAGALAVPAFVPPAIAAVPGLPDPDAGLLRRVAAAERWRAALRRAEAVCLRLHDAMRRHPDRPRPMTGSEADAARWDAIAGRLGIPAADARLDRLYARYENATEAAFEIPARTLPGLHAKLRLGVAVVKEHHPPGWEHIDCQCLDRALADLERLAAGPAA